MVTLAEFEKVQELLGRPGRPSPEKHDFAFVGLMKCGECGLAITASQRQNRYGKLYRHYHCTRRRLDYDCTQGVIQVYELEQQIAAHLDLLRLDTRFERWVLKRIERAAGDAQSHEDAARRTASEALPLVSKQLGNLTQLRLRDLISDAEFVQERTRLERDRLRLEEALEVGRNTASWYEHGKTVISFRNSVVVAFQNASPRQKRFILENVGVNLLLIDKKLKLDARKPFSVLPKSPSFPDLCTLVEELRTFCIDPANGAAIEAMRHMVDDFTSAL
jgi:hypothetical protein